MKSLWNVKGLRKRGLSFLRLPALLLPVLLLSGCWNANDVDELDYVNAVGIDYLPEEKQFVVYAQLISFSKVAKGEGNQDVKPVPAWIAEGRGKSYVEAVGRIMANSEHKLYWGHVTSLLLGDTLLRMTNVSDVLESFFRYYEMRYTMWVFGTRDSIPALFIASPNFERTRLGMILHSPEDNYFASSSIRPIRLSRFMAGFYEPYRCVLLPSVSLSKEYWKKNLEPVPSQRISGAYLIQGQKTLGALSMEQLQGLHWLERTTHRAWLDIEEGGEETAILRMRKPRYTIIEGEENGAPVYDLEVSVQGTVSELKRPMTEEELAGKAARLIEEEIRRTYAAGLKLKGDLYGLQQHRYRTAAVLPPRRKAELAAEKLKESSLRQIRVKPYIVSGGKYTLERYNQR
ncbi:Ger(x)C family spore germination protein [Paenibacillus mucilaginosus]|uniref:Germination protein, Ger(X)C family n=1 Tax=Paenibacillus mucilaginosus (strain KNP414) TaxID=1036673 RepID=F8FNU0_PAEMK|nr:Ger(x)C family spore germination C-terminal domain-containing protein [Paenibacillus mucilaginosus]AEI45009.1 germination protein, Ger(x)C family [Paenibacillus mucilaginosus KNP414]MCG7213085.1 spore gernimation protein GerC [Paenibacillus mucilaginosus]WDM26510.1 spore gernimation protein GerC [Paenibacillus mucilaginosus]